MVDEKVMRVVRADDERGAAGWGGETVLDFLWGAEVPDAVAEAAHAGTVCEDALQGALARYAMWLKSWAGPA